MFGRLTRIAVDLVAVSVVLAGVKRATGFVWVESSFPFLNDWSAAQSEGSVAAMSITDYRADPRRIA